MLSCKEAILGLYDTGVVPDAAVIATVTKPTTPQYSIAAVIPYTPTTSACNELKLVRAAAKVLLNFTNLDASNPHTVKYQIYVDNALVIDNSAGTVINQGSTLAAVEVPYQANPADATLNIAIYLWADDVTHVRLDNHRVLAGFGSESASAVAASVVKSYAQSIFATLAATSGSSTWTLKAANSGVTLASSADTNQVAGHVVLDNHMLPNSEFYFTPSASEFCYLTGISLV